MSVENFAELIDFCEGVLKHPPTFSKRRGWMLWWSPVSHALPLLTEETLVSYEAKIAAHMKQSFWLRWWTHSRILPLQQQVQWYHLRQSAKACQASLTPSNIAHLRQALLDTLRLLGYTALKERWFLNRQLRVCRKLYRIPMFSFPFKKSLSEEAILSQALDGWQKKLLSLGGFKSRLFPSRRSLDVGSKPTWSNEAECAMARKTAFDEAFAEGQGGYLGRHRRQDAETRLRDMHLYYRSLALALERCQEAGDNQVEKGAAFGHLSRLAQEGLALFSPWSPLGAVFQGIARDLEKKADLFSHVAGFIIPRHRHIQRQESALDELHEKLNEVKSMALKLPQDEVVRSCLMTIQQVKKNAYDYLGSRGSTHVLDGTSYELVRSSCDEINTQHNAFEQAFEERQQQLTQLKEAYQAKIAYQTTLEKHPVTLGYFSVKHRDLLTQCQAEIRVLLEAMENLFEMALPTDSELKALSAQLLVIEEKQTAYVAFYNGSHEFLVLDGKGPEAEIKAAAILGFHYRLPRYDESISTEFGSRFFYTPTNLSSLTFEEDFTTDSVKRAYRRALLKYAPDVNVGKPAPPWCFIHLSSHPNVQEEPRILFAHVGFTESVAYARQGNALYYVIKPGIINRVDKGDITLSGGESLTEKDKEELSAYHQKHYWGAYTRAIHESYQKLCNQRIGKVSWIAGENESAVETMDADLYFNKRQESEAGGHEYLRKFEEQKRVIDELERVWEEQRRAAEEERRVLEERRLADKAAAEEEKRVLEERRLADKVAAEKERRVLEERLSASEAAAEARRLADKAAFDEERRMDREKLAKNEAMLLRMMSYLEAREGVVKPSSEISSAHVVSASSSPRTGALGESLSGQPSVWSQSSSSTMFQSRASSPSVSRAAEISEELRTMEAESLSPNSKPSSEELSACLSNTSLN